MAKFCSEQMRNFPFNRVQALLAFLSLGVLAASFYFQYIQGLEPCPLCLMQRFMVIFLVFLTIAGIWVTKEKFKPWLCGFELLFAGAGIYFAGRQLWLQSLQTDHMPACLPDLEVLWQYFPFQEILKALFLGGGECGEINWQWLGLTMPGWALLYFLSIAISALYLLWRVKK